MLDFNNMISNAYSQRVHANTPAHQHANTHNTTKKIVTWDLTVDHTG